MNQKVLAKEGRLKRYRQYRKNRTSQNNQRKFCQQVGGDDAKIFQQLDAKETERIWTKIWQLHTKKHNEKTKWINNMTKELEVVKESSKEEIYIDLLKTSLKDIKLENARPWWNTWFLVQKIHLHSPRTSSRTEQMHTKSTRTRMDDQRKDHIDPNGSKQRNRFKQLQTHNLPTDDVENINSTNMEEIYYSLTNRVLFPEEQKGCRKGPRDTAELLYIDQHIPH